MSGHHIISLKYLLGAATALVVLTIITVGASFIEIPRPFDLIVALSLAFGKATVVAAIFMGLIWDKKINTMALLFSLLFFIIMIGITLLDTLYRDVPFWIYS
ncbi:MAG: cytochrome C oxidase subunit IV family protein [Balneolales bacterium]|nr:cytochrome C oxidase subunit IV family protein [Balneolales bacterium]